MTPQYEQGTHLLITRELATRSVRLSGVVVEDRGSAGIVWRDGDGRRYQVATDADLLAQYGITQTVVVLGEGE
ncbi:hypothetical protein ACPA54_07140 [Uniformispora flossi]|uniref:hypothetical protein n=1 Tax=Uniformispora flossi TaxID=3390723 RepID=UPI003C2BF8F6